MPPPLRAAAPFEIAYRPMSDDDLPFLADLYASTRAEEVAQTGWPLEAQRAFLAQQFDAQDRHYREHYPDAERLVIERAGAPIGRLYLRRSQTQIGIIDIALAPTSRGLGLGGAILADVIEEATQAGWSVSIHVEKVNPAMRLYHRLGFRMVEDVGVYDRLEYRASAEPDAIS